MATYVVGDIHGRLDVLQRLLRKLEPGSSDAVVFLGDYIDRGPDSFGVVDALLRFQDGCRGHVHFLMGNHEASMLRSLDDPRRHTWVTGMQGLPTIHSYNAELGRAFERRMASYGAALFLGDAELPYRELERAMPASHRGFFRGLVPFVRTKDVVCSHAGVSLEYESVESEDLEALIWGVPGWWDAYSGDDVIVYGHWGNGVDESGTVRPYEINRTYGIDCSSASELMAIRFPGAKVTHGGCE